MRLPRPRPRLPGSLASAGRRSLLPAGLVLTAVIVGAGSLVAVNAMARQTVQEELTYTFRGSALSLDSAIGDVRIVPTAQGEEISIRRRLTYGLRRPVVEERIDGDTFRIRDEGCPAQVAFPCTIHWLLQVPPHLSVDVRTASGSIHVLGLAGKVRLTSVSGSVKAVSASGKLLTLRSHSGAVSAQNTRSEQVVATSSSGAVSLTFRDPPSLVVGRSETAPVEVLLPDGDESYRIEATAPPDRLRYVTANEDPDARRRINIRSARSDVKVEQERNPDR